jgi:hypothetical protein
MRAHFGLPSVTSEETEGKPPIQVKFEIPYFTTSGIQVKIKMTFLRHLCALGETCSSPSVAPSQKRKL